MMDHDQDNDAELEAFFEAGRAASQPVPDRLMARVLADAQAEMPVTEPGGWRRILAAFGGLPALGGLVAATCVGFWLGVAPPAGLPDLAGAYLGVDAALEDSDASPNLSGFGWDIGEG